jgi:hypothetical protein
MRAAVNDALMIDDQHLRRRWWLMPLPAAWQQLLTEQNVFRALTLIVFCSIVFSLLFYCHFLPFGTDNNETFSSILHAKNMYLYGISSTYGLTSETTSPIDTVQFVYTHQGNFPRFYALLLYVLGARSAEAQILITTFTIGLASIIFAYLYMERRVNALLAFIFCSILITDYVMSLQWLVNTWRVWHFFFFFSTLLLAHAFADAAGSTLRTAGSCGLLLINFACLFYFELIFATFVAIFFALYLGYLLWDKPRRLVLGLVLSGLGSVLAIAVLLLQIILYLGWHGFLSDLSYTFFSRNAAPADLAAFRARVLEFMREHNLVFWDNFTLASSELRKPGEMLRLFFRYNLITYTPVLILLSFLLTAAAWLHAAAGALRIPLVPGIKAKVATWMERPAQLDTSAALLVPAFVLFGMVVVMSGNSYGITDNRHAVVVGSRLHLITTSLIFASATVLFVTICDKLAAGSLSLIYEWIPKAPAAVLLVVIIATALFQLYHLNLSYTDPLVVLLGAVAIGALAICRVSYRSGLTNGRIVIATSFLLGFALFAEYHASLYQPVHYDIAPNHYEPFWSDLIAKHGGPTFWKLAILGTGFLSTLMVLGVLDDAGWRWSLTRLCRIFPYWLIGISAYAITFSIAAGYIYTGYQVHNAPFTIFVTAVPGACAIYVLCSLGHESVGRFRDNYRVVGSRQAATVAVRGILVCGLLVAIAGMWVAVQGTYLRRIPPSRVASLFHALTKIGPTSTVVSTYAAPVAVATGQWSYFDPAFFHKGDSLDDRGYHVSQQDFRYLWFGDWKSNLAYRTPHYFVCWLHLNFFDVVSPTNRWSCGKTLDGIGDIRAGRSVFNHKELFRDQKYDLWSIVKLDWDYPPYLRQLEGISPDERVRARVVAKTDGIGFAVKINPTQQEDRAIAGVHYRLYTGVLGNPTCDGRPSHLHQVAGTPADLQLSPQFNGCVQIGVIPFTASKTGSEYFSNIMAIDGHAPK